MDAMITPIARMFVCALVAMLALQYVCAMDIHRIAPSIQRHTCQEADGALDFALVKQDLHKFFTTSQEWWPADHGHYGPFMIRLAWHCAGTYRSSDGRGGCDGAHQRFDPERSWDDNTNLDKARKLLWPIKQKYGNLLSWGDLIVLAGDTAIESMGGPVLGFCGGRMDAPDGTGSYELGPTPEQEALAPCPVNGNCSVPLGASTVGLIYVNPEGPMGQPNPAQSALDIRDVFGRMTWDDAETVALIGGGHAFGKTHGACPTGPGPRPSESPANPWPGTCGTGALKGKGPNTFTSGFEVQWTEKPTLWTNDYFKSLVSYGWEAHVGPGGHWQWRPTRLPQSSLGGPLPKIGMLTTDVALIHDPVYLELVKQYASNATLLDDAFSKAWYKLMTRDMGPTSRCLGKLVPPPQPFQCELPKPSTHQPDFHAVRADILELLHASSASLEADTAAGEPYNGALFVTLAWQCASTFRATDFRGGCNGARIRFSPAKDWPSNVGLDQVLQVLEAVKSKHPTLSYADLIVLAGTVALEEAGGHALKFCGARSDATDTCGLAVLAPREYRDELIGLRDNIKVMGLTPREAVALAGRLRSPSQQRRLGYSGSWTAEPSTLSHEYFKVLLDEQWEFSQSAAGKPEYRAANKTVFMTPSDLALTWDAELLAIAQEYAADNEAFLRDFAAAWTKFVNADRFRGPTGNVCQDCP